MDPSNTQRVQVRQHKPGARNQLLSSIADLPIANLLPQVWAINAVMAHR
jgi:hypothetical protein